MRSLLLLSCAVVSSAVSGAAAAQRRGDAVRALDDLAACRSIAADAERLACFDRVAGGIAASRESGELLAFDRKEVTAERRRNFGLADVPDGAGAEAAKRAAAVRELTSTITGVSQGPGFGLWNLQLANGQVWQTLAAERYGPRAGASIKLTTTVTGGHRASIDRTRPVQVRRLR